MSEANSASVWVVLLAGGSGSRMSAELPKQFLLLKGRPILSHSLRTFLEWPRLAGLCLVSKGDVLERARTVAREESAVLKGQGEKLVFAEGGATRHASTLAGINRLRAGLAPTDLLFIHDAARPLIDRAELERLAGVFKQDGPALASLVSRITDTIVAAEGLPGRMSERLDRDRLFAVKTPQALRVSALGKLMSIPERSEFTDLLSWGAAAGINGALVEAGALNHKVTTDRDLRFLEGV